MDPTDQPVYREVQREDRAWIWLIVVAVSILPWIAFVLQIILGRPFGSNPAPNAAIWLLLAVFGIALPVLVVAMRLVVEVSSREVMIRYAPFVRRIIALERIRQCEARQYRPIREYLGWGIRWTPWRGTAYIVSGDMGVQLSLDGGKRVLIGSRQPEALAEAINRHLE